ncbi:malonate--CoA ligase ACSF3, mitochondrial-like [Artemia franciscana]|uniref:Uncharacterized protein n=1 Tax=Artemia franciscana TaxID=6661 RepID=A0AA88HDC3_ARTSF|nr:hypothetical protein QYM36_018066 [Artemia franciscana]KAK2703471.1 hypothetical protein QYM36_018066 [Artemia franciscana]
MLFLEKVYHGFLRQKGLKALSVRSNHILRQFNESEAAKIAIYDCREEVAYGKLRSVSIVLGNEISSLLSTKGQGKNVAFLTPNDARYVFTQFGIWLGGNTAVPLSPNHPPSMLEYFIEDSQAGIVLATSEFVDKLLPICKSLRKELVNLDDVIKVASHPQTDDWNPVEAENAMILYTSGTTGKPKGVVLTHNNLISQVNCLLDSWGWNTNDRILHTLPLHHTHGIVNALLCPLIKGASCVMLPKFSASDVWNSLLSLDESKQITVFMAVPTVYSKLIEYFENRWDLNLEKRNFTKALCSENIRLMVSGSAPLPVPVYEQWKELTGHNLLERYGMTEIGMALSNPLDGERRPGYVGTPLPGVNVRIVNFTPSAPNGQYEVVCHGTSKGTTITQGRKSPYIGELLIKSASVFKEYWNQPEETSKEFTIDKWFRTGDTAEYKNGAYRILGRTSVDIIKSGGYKLSALSIETILLEHGDILDCAIIGRPDITWGQKVAAVIVLRPGSKLTLKEIRSWASDKMASYMLPAELKVVSEIPRNAMGKVNKKELMKTYD